MTRIGLYLFSRLVRSTGIPTLALYFLLSPIPSAALDLVPGNYRCDPVAGNLIHNRTSQPLTDSILRTTLQRYQTVRRNKILANKLRTLSRLVQSCWLNRQNQVDNGTSEASLVAEYLFSEATGTTVHDSSGISPTVNLGFDSTRVRWLEGRNGVQLTQAKALITSTGPASKINRVLKSQGRFTVETWVAVDSLTTRQAARILSLSGGDADNRANFQLLQLDRGLHVRAKIKRGRNSSWLTLPISRAFSVPGRLMHIVVTYDGVGLQVYINGTLRGSLDAIGASLSTWLESYRLNLGNEFSLRRDFRGSLRSQSFFSRALLPREIVEHFLAGPTVSRGVSSSSAPATSSNPASSAESSTTSSSSSSSQGVSSSSASSVPGAYACDSPALVNDDFLQSNPIALGISENLQWQTNAGLIPTSTAPGHPLVEESTVFQLDFENPQIPGQDSSLLNLNMSCSNCPTVASGGRIGQAATFSGSNGLVTEASLERYRFSNRDFTWSTWLQSTAAGNLSILGTYCGYGHLQSFFRMEDGRIRAYINPEGVLETNLLSSRGSLNDGQWHHIVAQRIAATGEVRIYIDGVLDSSVTGPANGGAITCGRLAIGMSGLGFPAQNAFRGRLDGVAFLDRALSAAEISHLAQAVRTRGQFVSRELSFSRPVYALQGNVLEAHAGRTQMEVSLDGNTWCPIDGELHNRACSGPSDRVRYRALVNDDTELAGAQIHADCTPRCIDFDGDGYSQIAASAPFCPHQELDCTDSNAFINPGVVNQYCSCGSSPNATEICGDSIDNDCDGAVDANDNECYSNGTIFYVSQSHGADSNNGLSPTTAWQSIAMVQSALNNSRIHAGDKVLFRRGDTWSEGTLSIHVTGTADHPIVFGAYGVGERPHVHYSAPATPIYISASTYLTIESLHFTRASRQLAVLGVSFDPQHISDRVTLRDMHLDGLGYGFSIYSTNFLLEDSIVENCENSLSGGGHAQGMWVYGGSDYGIVRNNRFHNNGKYHTIYDHNIYLGGGNYWLFEGNSLSGDSGTSIVFHGVQRGHIIRNNQFFDNTANMAMDISDYSTGQYLQDFIVENNRVFNNRGGGFWIRGAVNLLVRNNLFYNNSTIFNIGSGVDHETTMTVEHNTFFGNTGLLSASGAPNVIFQENILDRGGVSGTAILQFNENLAGTADARFVDAATGNFALRPDSPAIDAAVASLTLTSDFFGNSRPVDGNSDGIARSDLGAIEMH